MARRLVNRIVTLTALAVTAGFAPLGAARAQEPAKPYPYREEEVSVASAQGVRLACTLTVPAVHGPFPAVVLITGSGAQDRDEARPNHRPFLVLADHLTRRGIGVLRCDDRGFARSTGDFVSATSADFAVDTQAEAAWLRARSGVDAAHVGLIGHSEGGMIAPMVAARDPKIAFIVLMAGPGAPIRDLMAAQRAAVARVNGVDPATAARNVAEMTRLDIAVAEAKDAYAAEAAVTRIMQAETPGMPAGAIGLQAKYLSSPWYRFFVAYDPQVELAKVKVPILALDGDKDVQVVSSQNLPAIRAATQANSDVTTLELPGVNHLFQTASTGSPSEYNQIQETVAPIALTTISDWIARHTGKGASR